MGLYDYTVYDFICRNATIYPDRECIVFNDTRLTHKAYKERCDRLAAGLIKAGIKKGDRLGVLAHNCDEFMILYAAAAKLGQSGIWVHSVSRAASISPPVKAE